MNKLKDYMINNQEILGEEKNLKYKIFNYFHSMLSSKGTIKFTILYILHIFEIIQLISFAFSQPLILNWNLSDKASEKIEIIISGFRLVPLFKFISIDSYSIILLFFFAIILILAFGLIIQIMFYNENSTFFTRMLYFTKTLIPYLTIFLFLPINELFLIPLKCHNNIFIDRGVVCWKTKHLFYAIIGIFGDICFIVIVYIFILPPIRNYLIY